jgi:hypothetical protein
MWSGLDNCIFQYQLYQVEINGTYILPTSWDQPYPQNDNDFVESIAVAFGKVKSLAPDIYLMANEVDIKIAFHF